MNDHKFEETLRIQLHQELADQLNESDDDVPRVDLASSVRQRIESELDRQQSTVVKQSGEPRRSVKRTSPFWRLAIAATILLVAFLGFSRLTNNDPSLENDSQLASQFDRIEHLALTSQEKATLKKADEVPSTRSANETVDIRVIDASIVSSLNSIKRPHDSIRGLVAQLSTRDLSASETVSRPAKIVAQQNEHLIGGLASRILGRSITRN